MEKCVELLTEKVEKLSQPPIQPAPIVQTPVDENKEIEQLKDNASLSLVQKRQSETSQSMDNAQSNTNIEMGNKGNSVSSPSIVSDPGSAPAKKQSTNWNTKTLKKRMNRLRKKKKMKTIDAVKPVENIGEPKQDDSSSNL